MSEQEKNEMQERCSSGEQFVWVRLKFNKREGIYSARTGAFIYTDERGLAAAGEGDREHYDLFINVCDDDEKVRHSTALLNKKRNTIVDSNGVCEGCKKYGECWEKRTVPKTLLDPNVGPIP